MIITKQHNGLVISDIIDNVRVKRLYIGHTTQQAKKLFKKEFLKAK